VIRSVKQTGYILLPVIVVITLVAAIALLMNTESALESNTAGSELEARQAQYVAEAGMSHALWLARQQGCGPYSDLIGQPLGNDKYTTRLTTDLGSISGYSTLVDQDSWILNDNPSQNHASDTSLHVSSDGGDIERSLLRYDLSPVPAKAAILSATAWFYVDSEHSEGSVDIHRITADWTETDATWDSMGDNLDSSVLATIPTQPAGDVWVSVNLTGQIQAWVNGEPNYGITLNTTSDGVDAEYASRESANEPYLEILVGVAPTSPVNLKSEGTLANGITRSLNNVDVTLVQQPGFVQLQPDAAEGKDAEIWDQAPNNNYGASAETWVSSAASDTTRSLLRFNTVAIPAGAQILQATLSLERQSGSGADQPVSAHRILNPWSEDAVTWNQRESGTNWDTAGADFDNTAVATTPVGPVNQRYEWNIAPLVQGWVDGSYPNHGVALVAAIPGMPGERFYTSDDGDPTRHPRLTISYSCECGTVCVPPQGSGKLLMVVINPTTLVAEDQKAKDLFESWGYAVSVISESANQSAYDALVAVNDVVFISETVNSNSVGTKLVNAPIGVISQDGDYNPDLGLATGDTLKVGTDIDITSTDHYITRVFPVGALPIYAADMEQLVTTGAFTADQQSLAEIGGDPSLVVLDRGAAMEGGGNAAGRRVVLPLGTRYRFNWDYLNANGRLLVQRALDWGMNKDKVSKGNVLLVVVNPSSLTTQESAKKTLFESWGYNVNLIDESDTQPDFDAAVAVNNVVYITEDVSSSNVNTKLVNAAIGVVTEEDNLSDEFGMAAGIAWESGTQVEINDNSHYITSPFSLGLLTIFTANESLAYVTGTQSPDLGRLASSASGYGVVTLEAGAALFGGGSAAGRRAQLPWGGDGFDVNHLNDDGLTILQRALAWGATIADPADTIILSTHDAAELGGLAFTAADLVEYDPATDTATLYFDGANLFTDPSENVQSAHVLGNGHIILSTRDNATLGGLSFTQADLVDYDPGSGIATLFFDGASLFSDPLTRIASAQVLANGHIILSTWSDATLGGLAFTLAQLVKYNPVTDAATLYFDGTTLFGDPSDKIDAVHVLGNGHIVLSTWNANTLGGLSFGEGDLVEYDPVTDTATLYFDGAASFTDPLEKLVAAHINGDDGPPIAGPVAHWKLDDGSGPTAIDSVGGNDSTLNGDSSWTTGTLAGALEFDGSGDYATTDNDFTPPPVGTVLFWMKVPGSPGSHGRILGLHDSWEVRHVTTGTSDGIPYGLVFDLGVTGVNTEFVTTVTVDTPDQWYFVAATYDTNNDAYQVYLDGVLHKSGTYPSSLSIPASNPISLGTRTGSSNYFTGTLDDVQIYDRILSASEIADLYATGAPATADYTELHEPWSAIDKDIWEPVDLAPLGVPADAVVEVAVINVDGGNRRWGGVRAFGSTLDRRLQLHKAESGGMDVVTMHVQVDASSRIEHYSDDTNDISFVALGYWSGVSYVELMEPFSADASNSWVPEDVSDDGLGANQVAEVAMANTSTGAERLAGVREVGSTWQRRFNLHEAESGGVDAYSMMVNTNASADVEVFAQNAGDVDFYVLGYWNTPPGTYVENGTGAWTASTTSWEAIDLSGIGVPANAVVQVTIGNLNQSNERLMGVRTIGSSLDRRLDLHKAEAGGSERATWHVKVDAGSNLQSYSETSGTAYRFDPVGWWVLSP